MTTGKPQWLRLPRPTQCCSTEAAAPAIGCSEPPPQKQIEHEDIAAMPGLDNLMKLYFGGEMEAAFAFSGQVAGRIDEVLPVADILRTAWDDCQKRLGELGSWAKL